MTARTPPLPPVFPETGRGRTLVLGDVHGAHRALLQVLERSSFDPASDTLIFLGDVADGWPEVRECVDELIRVPHLIPLMGNHDQWAYEWMTFGAKPFRWIAQGGRSTLDSYADGVPALHRAYFRSLLFSFRDEQGRLYVHGGFPPDVGLADTTPDRLIWDRTLWEDSLAEQQAADEMGDDAVPLTGWPEIYIGHTHTTRITTERPVHAAGVWNLDQGAGWSGRLTLMDVDTKEFWQSDVVTELYPEAASARGAA